MADSEYGGRKLGEMNGTSYGGNVGKKPTKDADKDNAKLIERMRAEYEGGWNKDRDNKEEAYRDLKLLGDDKAEHWDETALKERTTEGRPALIVNQCPQFVRQVTGDMRQMKPAIKVVPVDDAASKEVAAKVLPGMIRYIEKRSNAQHIYFNAADQQAGCGIGHWRVNHEYSSSQTFNQEIRIEPIPDGVAVVWDPDAVLPDRSDAVCCFVPVDMERRKFEEKYPDASPDPLSPETMAAWTAWFADDHVRIAEWFYKEPETKLLALYPDGAIDDVTDDEEGQQLAGQAGAKLEKREGHCIYRALVTANEILEGPDKWPGPDIPVVPLIGEEVQIGRTTVRRGVVRPLRDVQRIFNYGISAKTEVIALQPKSPWIGTDAQFEKYEDEWEVANTRNLSHLRYTNVPGVPPPQRVGPAVATQSLDGLLVEMQEAMHSTTGIYPSALGAKSNEVSGRAILARQREGDTGTYVYVANFTGALQRTGQIIVNLIPNIYDTARVIQIAGEDGKIDQLPINQPGFNEDPNEAGMGPGIGLNDVTVGAYQVAVEMGPSFSTKREEAREGMKDLMQALGPEGSMMFIDMFVKQMDWPLSDKIAERAKFMLPPAIQAKEAKEAGEPPPEPPPPPPPTPEQQKAMELQQQKNQEAVQSNIELARKNEIEDKKAQLEAEKIEMERAQMPIVRDLSEKLLELARHNDELTARLQAAEIQHEVEKGEMTFSLLQAKQACSEEEGVQQNIEKARANELEDRRQQLELCKIDAEFEAGQRDKGEEVQKNIQTSRQGEIDSRRHELEFEKIDHEREQMRNPQPAAAAAPAPADVDTKQQQEIDELKRQIEQLVELVGEMADQRQPQQPTSPPPTDHTPALIDVIGKFASRRSPSGATRAPDGSMKLTYDEGAPPEAPPLVPDQEPPV
jgi:Phage P22-like portal protein